MILEETFVVDQPRDRVWTFFLTEVERVARCIPGVGDFDDLGGEHYHVTLTQKIGHLSATFDLKAALVDKEPEHRVTFTAAGRCVRGVRGDMSSKNQVELADDAGGSTKVSLKCDLVLGGMVGSIGNKAVTAKAKVVVKEFASKLSAEIQSWAAR
ncbi:MAG: CoxG family protein [Acidimicrobiales bacterium]